MDEKTASNSDELERLRAENQELRRQRDFFVTEHRWGAHLAAIIILGPRLTESIRQWLARTSPQNPLPLEETANLAAAVVRRLLSVGLVGLLIPTGLMLWQNLLIRDQNQYFREQTNELRKQILIQEEQGDLTTRNDLLETLYGGKRAGTSMRTRVAALEALTALDNKLIEQGKTQKSKVNVRAVDLSCDPSSTEECADLSMMRLVRADFTGANLRGADLSYADLRDSSFVGADLRDANLQGASLDGTQFRDSWPMLNDPAFASVNQELILAAKPFDLQETYYGKVDFAIELISISQSAKDAINRHTRAALFNENTKIGIFGQSKLVFDKYLIISVDLHTLLPLGTIAPDDPSTLGIRFKRLRILDSLQSQAHGLFGSYRVDLSLTPREPEPTIACTPGVFEKQLIEFEHMSLEDQTNALKEICRHPTRPLAPPLPE